MSVHLMDDLIKAVWNFAHNDCDRRAVRQWRNKTEKILVDLLGPDHYYTQTLKRIFDERAGRSLLAAGGILIAAREELLRSGGRVLG